MNPLRPRHFSTRSPSAGSNSMQRSRRRAATARWLKTASRDECLRYRGGVSTGKTVPHTVVITQCRQSVEITRQNPFARKELQHSVGASVNCAFPYRRTRDGTSIYKKLGALEARERLLAVRITAIAKRACGKPEQRFSRNRRARIEAQDTPEPVALNRSTLLSWMARSASAAAHSRPLPSRRSTAARRSCQPANRIPGRAQAGHLAAIEEGSEPAVGRVHGPEHRGRRRPPGGPVSLPASGWTQRMSERVKTSTGSQDLLSYVPVSR